MILSILNIFLFLQHVTCIVHQVHVINNPPFLSLRNLYEYSPAYGGSSSLNYYYANLYLGQDAKPQSYILDTGSSITTAPCEPYIQSVGKHLNSYHTIKSPAKVIECGTKECDLVSSSCNSNKQCSFSISYAEGSSLSGIFVNELVRIGNNYKNDKGHYLPIGCTVKETKLFVTQLADGIMGLSNLPKALIPMLYNNKIIERKLFSLCFAQFGGYFSVGEIDSEYHLEKQVNYTKITSNGQFYYVAINSIQIGNNDLITPVSVGSTSKTFTGFIDSGSTITYFPRDIGEKMINYIQSHCDLPQHKGKCGTFENDRDLGPCFVFDNKDAQIEALTHHWPSISYNINNDYQYVLTPLEYYFDYPDASANKTRACLGFTKTGGKITFGSTWLHGHDVIFDLENGKIGFVKADCNRGVREVNGVESKEGTNNENEINVNVNTTCIEEKKEMQKFIFAYSITCIVLVVLVVFMVIAICYLRRSKNFCCIKIVRNVPMTYGGEIEIDAEVSKTFPPEKDNQIIELQTSKEDKEEKDQNVI